MGKVGFNCDTQYSQQDRAKNRTMVSEYHRISSPLKLVYYRGYINVSYSYSGRVFRYPLFKVEERLFSTKMTALKESPLYDCDAVVKEIEEKVNAINAALIEIEQQREPGETITKKIVDAYIQFRDEKAKKKVAVSKGLIDDFSIWLEDFKKQKYDEEVRMGVVPRKVHPTTKDYTSTLNLLRDFEYDNYSKPIQVADVDNAFLTDLIQYCYEPRVSDEDHTYLTEGDMINKTIQKRLDCLFTFMTKYYKQVPNEVKKPKLEQGEKVIIRLDREELRQLENTDIKEPDYIKCRDYMLFLAFTGLRFSDFTRIDRSFYYPETNELVLTTQKTNSNCRIFLFDKAKEIGLKYDFTFRDYTNQGLNRAMKAMLKKYDLYGEPFTKTYMKQGRQVEEGLKREFISCHACRRSFISIMAECGLDVYDIMSMTGHKKVETLKYYLDIFGKSRREKYIKVNEMLK